MKKLFAVLATLLLTTCMVDAQKPGVLLLDADVLQQLRSQMAGNTIIAHKIKLLQARADGYMAMKPVSVMDKKLTPVSGNKHDYMSQAPYFWYDSSKPNGLPYMRRDGERNPEILKITDRKNIGDLQEAVQVLAMAYYFSGQEKYAAKASTLLHHWFLNEATRMNPNLDYAQGIPGVNDGRGIGIIETIALTHIADAALLLNGSAAWPPKTAQQLKDWYAQYLNWMLTSKNGIDEQQAKNNHGTYYAMQVADFAMYTGNKSVAVQAIEEAKKRMEKQLLPDGSMPLELERTTAKHYTTFNLRAWFQLATLASHVGIDLWHYQAPSKASLQKALDWFVPYALEQKPWPYQQITPYDKADLYGLLVQAAAQYGDNKYLQQARQLGAVPADVISALIYPDL